MFEHSFFDLRTWWPPIVAALGGLAIGILIRRTVLRWVARMAEKTAWKYDDVLVDALEAPVVVWFALLGLRLAARLMQLSPDVESVVATVILIMGIMSVAWAIARFTGGALRAGAQAGHLPAASLFASMARVLIMMIGALMALQAMGIAITPIIGALGIGGLAVGLALQDTLANFFAGLRIIAARKIRPGDFIRLDSGQEGFVEDINWGLTTVREGAGNIIIVPNAKLGTAIVVNYALPALPQIVVVNMGVSYDADLAQVERVTLEEALATQHAVPEAIAAFTPAMRFKEFGESSINFFVVLQARTYQERWQVVSDFVKRIHGRYRAEGIEIPYPHRVIITKTEDSAPKS
jgi:small-conductance mechanosensitive channel